MPLAILQHTDLLPRSFQPLLTLPQVYEAVVTQGLERSLARALATAGERGHGRVVAMTDPSLIDHERQVPSESPPVSAVNLRGVAPALEPQVTLRTDDHGVRMLALAPHVPMIRARLEGVMALYTLCSTSVSLQGSMWIRRATSPARHSSSPGRTATYASGGLSHAPHHWTRHRRRTRRPVCSACTRGRALHPMAGGGDARAA